MILVTGATGLVGSHLLVQLLQEKEAVKALYRDEQKKEHIKTIFKYYKKAPLFEKIIWVKADITDIPALEITFENVTKVYHCAAFISFDPRDEMLLRKTNIEGTANVVNCCIAFKVEKLCYVSSIAALGDGKDTKSIITEETEWNPEKLHGDYAITKFGAEMEVWRAHQEGLQVVIVNPGVIFGYGFPDNGSANLIKMIRKGNPFYTKGIIGIIGVTDVVQCMIKLMNSTISGERYTLVAENISIQNLMFKIADALQVKRPYIYTNKAITSIAWRLDWLLCKLSNRRRVLTKATAKASHTKTLYSNKKISTALHFTFSETKII